MTTVRPPRAGALPRVACGALLLTAGLMLNACSSSPNLNAPSTVAVPASNSRADDPPQVAQYNASPLLVGASFGKPGRQGGVPYTVNEGGDVVQIQGSSTTIATTVYTGGNFSNIQLRYQLGVTTPITPTSVAVVPGQGFVLDGRLIVLQSIQPLNNSTLASASILVFPSSAVSGLARA